MKKLQTGPRGGQYWIDDNGKKHYVKKIVDKPIESRVPFWLKDADKKTQHMAAVINYNHEEIVAECEYCGRGLTRSDVNDYGSLCRDCFLKEYENN